MAYLKLLLLKYKNIEPAVLQMLWGEFYLQLINASFFLYLNYYMTHEGYHDFEIAHLVSYRFLAVMFFSIPVGLLAKGRSLKPFFQISSIMAPLVALLIIYAISIHNDTLLIAGFLLWSLSFALYQIPGLPFILLNSHSKNHSEAIAAYFLTWSVAICLCGALGFLLHFISPEFFSDKILLILFTLIGAFSLWHVQKIKIKEKVSDKNKLINIRADYDWFLIAKVTFPTFIIAVGAGFTIPFINLFFLNVHGLSSHAFAGIGSLSYLLVAFGVFIIPEVKRRSNYFVAITLIQSFSIIFLVLLATTQFYSHWAIALPLALIFFIFRQPLMNVAGPMTSELTMYYVGEKNRELVSALNAAIWSGSWFVSSQIFGGLRAAGYSYATIFFITAALYSIGVMWYYFLIKDYYRLKKRSHEYSNTHEL